MGKVLVIKGADFSGCAVNDVAVKNITGLFEFSDGTAFACSSYTQKVTYNSTAVFATSVVNVEKYAGNLIKIILPRYTKSSGGLTNYGTVFTAENPVEDVTDVLETRLPIEMASEVGLYEAKEYDVTIPLDAKFMCVTWYKQDKVEEYNLPNFYCKVYF